MTTIIKLHKHFATVKFQNGEIDSTYVSTDEQGEKYIVGQNRNKLLLKDCKKQTVKKEELKEYRFEVEYEHKGRVDGWAFTETKVEANSYDEALEKVKNNFKTIYEISEA